MRKPWVKKYKKYCSKVKYGGGGLSLGAIQVLCDAMGMGGYQISCKKPLQGCRPMVQCQLLALRGGGWVGVNFLENKHYVTLEWPLFLKAWFCPQGVLS